MADLLLEAEVAAMLHRSRQFVRKLRQAGELRWLPGAGRAPILIDKQSVLDYLDRQMQWAASPTPALRATRRQGRSSPEAAIKREKALGQLLYRTKSVMAKRP